MRYFRVTDPMETDWAWMCQAETEEEARKKYAEYYDKEIGEWEELIELHLSDVLGYYIDEQGLSQKHMSAIVLAVPEIKEMLEKWLKTFED